MCRPSCHGSQPRRSCLTVTSRACSISFDAREVLHVTFGSVLEAFGPQLYESAAPTKRYTMRRYRRISAGTWFRTGSGRR